MLTHAGIDRDLAIGWYKKNRARTAALFDLLVDDAYYAQPIALRHPIVFYEGHLPAFSLNTLVKKGLGRDGVDSELERLFARGIDPDEKDASGAGLTWPDRERVRAFADAADALVLDALAKADLDQPGHPLMDGAQAVYTILEHEAMHQETLLYMWHQLPHAQKRRPDDYRVALSHSAASAFAEATADGKAASLHPDASRRVVVPAGRTILGADRGSIPFGWDNEFGSLALDVPAFSIDRLNVSNGEYLEFVKNGGAAPAFWTNLDGQWQWLGMFERIPLPLDWPVYVSQADAAAYAEWRGGRLPTEAEYQRAAYGSPDGRARAYPWGDAPPDDTRGVFDFASWEPHPVGSHPAGRSAWGVDDLLGNGWEWTSSVFAPLPGFVPLASYPEYSADFFDGAHYVMKGASPATARELLRPTFRNWFRARYPYVYATFRCVRNAQ